MKKMTRTLGLVVALLTLILTIAPSLTPSTFAQDNQITYGKIMDPASGAQGDDSDTAIVVRYVGTGSGKVAVAADGNLTFTSGTEGAEAAETDFECPVSGALGGVLDVSDSACNTLGKVVDTINGYCTGCAGTASKWRAFIVDGKRSDSSDDALVTIAATAAGPIAGLNLLWDTSVALKTTIALIPQAARDAGAQFWMEGRDNKPQSNPFVGQRAKFIIGNATANYASGTSILTVESCKPVNRLGAAGSETCTTLYSQAGGADDTNKIFDFTPYGIYGGKDAKLLVRMTNSVTMDTTTFYAYGETWPYR